MLLEHDGLPAAPIASRDWTREFVIESNDAAAWSISCCRADDVLVDQGITHTLSSGTSYRTLWNGNSWISFDVWTHALPKAKTLLVTDGNATVVASNGEHRLTGQDRYFVLTFDVTSSYAPFVYGVNTIVVPPSLFLDSKLKADFDQGTYSPLTNAKLYGEDLGKLAVSEGVAGVIARSLCGSNSNGVLNRLLEVGQLLHKGLVDLATFLVDLGQAIWNWEMRARLPQVNRESVVVLDAFNNRRAVRTSTP